MISAYGQHFHATHALSWGIYILAHSTTPTDLLPEELTVSASLLSSTLKLHVYMQFERGGKASSDSGFSFKIIFVNSCWVSLYFWVKYRARLDDVDVYSHFEQRCL